jgi:peptidyl-prolyl cis-trans isomerase SurA
MIRKLTIFLLLVSSLSWGAVPLDRVKAIVNDGVITELELQQHLVWVKKQLPPQTTPPPNFSEQILDQMILQKIQLQFAEKSGIQVDDRALDDQLAGLAKSNGLSLEAFRQQLQKEGMPFDAFREEVRQEMILAQLQRRDVLNQISVSPQEIEHYLQSTQKADTEYRIRHILIPLPAEPTPEQITKTEKEATQLLKTLQKGVSFETTAMQHSKGQQALQGGDLGWRSKSALPTLFVDDLDILSTGQIKGLYRNASGFHIIQLTDKRKSIAPAPVVLTHVRHILLKDEAQIRTVSALLSSGSDFAKLAQERSDDFQSKQRGGDLGFLSPEEVSPTFKTAMNRLPLFTVSQPFQTEAGWHIVEVLDRKEITLSQDALREKAHRALHTRKFEEKLVDWQLELRDHAYVEQVKS